MRSTSTASTRTDRPSGRRGLTGALLPAAPSAVAVSAPLGGAACRWPVLLAAAILVAVSGCDALGADETAGDGVRLVGPPGYGPVPEPYFNPTTTAKVALGQRLFHDPLLSGDGSVACATCHRADRAFTDALPVSRGVGGRAGLRNAPSLLDVAYRRPLFWDGGSPSLEAQVLAPLEAEDEMDADLAALLDRLAAHAEYPALFDAAFGEGPSVATLTRALAAFERTLLSGPTPYDRHRAGEVGALPDAARRGLALFEGRAGCVACHAAPRFTTDGFEDNGLARALSDSGRARVTLRPEDAYRFRVPSLRGVARTAPYMHDGRFATLEEVVAHYDRGGEGTPGQSPHVRPLRLTPEERADLVAFLRALSDETPP